MHYEGLYLTNQKSWKLGLGVGRGFSLIFWKILEKTSSNVDSLIGSKLPQIESPCLTTIIGLEIYLEHRQLQ